jgi:hypothetical protein
MVLPPPSPKTSAEPKRRRMSKPTPAPKSNSEPKGRRRPKPTPGPETSSKPRRRRRPKPTVTLFGPDPLSQHYADRLEGVYDCIDRLTINAYFPIAQAPGGFRTWWRDLFDSDDNLDNNHLMRLAGRFSAASAAGPRSTGSRASTAEPASGSTKSANSICPPIRRSPASSAS